MSSGKDVTERLAELRALIREYDRHYYVLGEQLVADVEYDRLYGELQALETAHPELITQDSPTQRVGSALASGSSVATIEHQVPMLSIASLFTEEEVRDFDERIRKLLATEGEVAYAVEPKYDGVSASVIYEHGELVRAVSRGDGARGEDIQRHMRTLRTVPLRLYDSAHEIPELLEVRGEVILAREHFDAWNERQAEEGKPRLANARNAVAGLLKRLDPAESARVPMVLISYSLVRLEGIPWPATQLDALEMLRGFGFHVSGERDRRIGIDAVLAYHADLEARRDELPYEMDGVVAKVDTIADHETLGSTARTPRWLMAIKFAARQATTRLERIDVQVGRTGRLTPRAVLEPVPLAGVTIRHATLHNARYVAELDVREGDRVFIERAGDVIPKVVQRVPEPERDEADRSPPFAMPTHCPVCASEVIARGEHHYCPNAECRDQVQGRIEHLASRRALDIEGLGEKSVKQLCEAGILEQVADVFRIDPERIAALPGFGKRSATKLLEQVEAAKTKDVARWLVALGIPEVGEATATLLADRFGTIEALRAADEDDLVEIEGIGPEMANSIRTFFATEGNVDLLAQLETLGVRPAPRQVVRPDDLAHADLPLGGQTYVLTGTLSSMGRDEAKQRLQALGAKVSSSVSKKTSCVVLGANPGSKADKAAQLELKTIDETAFLALLTDLEGTS
ncbi:MAG: NAD-dependent DNA ligase LigA [Planctomycetes bacterium]|nr:NAD-dependent DNA ligase LigA [Planctomycetota bacterium]MCB9890905.1 NAD-dependent DNA ligase LigA [Planctomycetota bacterium]